MIHEPGLKIIDYKIYFKIKDKRIVSRKPVQKITNYFERIYFDLI
jgi:hypothetical protein